MLPPGTMRLSDFDYHLPPGRIATRPVEPRDEARLLVVRRGGGPLEDRVFRDLPDLLDPGDLLVVNDTRVIPARLVGRRVGTGGEVEVFLLRPEEDRGEEGRRWRALLGPARRMRPGVRIAFEGAQCEVVAEHEGGERSVVFAGEEPVLSIAERVGAVPLPPYMQREADAADRDAYQTVFARVPGAVAAPTAGLHLTDALLARLSARGIGLATVTLHVGPGTFRPVTVDDVSQHRMDAEPYVLPAAAADAIAAAKAAGRRVVAVGTTSTRTLEAVAAAHGRVVAGSGSTDLFIRPGHVFRAVDALVTNFHLPRSTLLMLVSAFAGRERVLEAYAHAVASGYRFYSYGDAMLIA
jgi:S-adenosylmethionine:tRNA ribosyltransferase-isomerase